MGAILDYVTEPFVDMGTRLLQLLRIRVCGSVEFSAVATVVTVADLAELVDPGTILALGCPLPWILATVSEKDVRSRRVKASLINSCLSNLWIFAHVKTKDVGAVLRKIFLVNNGAAHRLFLGHRLEPAVFCAVLERPGTSTAVHIDLC